MSIHICFFHNYSLPCISQAQYKALADAHAPCPEKISKLRHSLGSLGEEKRAKEQELKLTKKQLETITLISEDRNRKLAAAMAELETTLVCVCVCVLCVYVCVLWLSARPRWCVCVCV